MRHLSSFIAPDAWFTSSYSGGNATECVQAAAVPQGAAVRDSKAQDGPMLTFGAQSWATFVQTLKGQP
jgi:hypothetical protein